MARSQRPVRTRRTETVRTTTLRELVDTLFEPELRDAERAFLNANPDLRGLETIPAGTSIALPEGLTVVDSGAARAVARSEATVRVVGLLGETRTSRSEAMNARLAGAERAAKVQLGRADALKQQEDDVAKRVWEDVTRLVAVARGDQADR
jgi:hypothetical protein